MTRGRRSLRPSGAPRGPDGDAAVSSVVAAVLLFALFTTATLLWTFQTLPEWVEARESAHQDATVERLSSLKSGLESLAASDNTGAVTVPVALAPRPVALLQAATASGDLSYDDGITLTGSFTTPTIHLLDGTAIGDPQEDVDGDTFSDVGQLEALSLRLATTGIAAGDEAWVQVEFSTGSGATLQTVTARLTHSGQNGATTCSGAEVRLTITGTTTQEHVLLCDVGNSLAGYTVDLLSGAHSIKGHLARLPSGRTMTFTDLTGTGTFQAMWRDSEGLLQAEGSGSSSTYAIDQSGGALVYTPSYQELDQQAVAFEGGAIVRGQSDGAAMLTPPSWSLDVDGGVGHLEWTVVELSGEGSRGGQGGATASIRVLSAQSVVLDTSTASFTLTSERAAAWRSFWQDEALIAGLSSDMATSGTGDTAVLDLGTGTEVNSWRIHITTIQAEVQVL